MPRRDGLSGPFPSSSPRPRTPPVRWSIPRRIESAIFGSLTRPRLSGRVSSCAALVSGLLCTSGALSGAQGWTSLALAIPAEDPDLSQRFLVTDIPVTGKAKKFLVTVSGHVGQASISLLTEAGQEALYVFIESETEHVGNLRFTLPVDMADRGDMISARLGSENEAMFELPDDAEIKLTIRAKELEFQGQDVKELQSEFEVRHTLIDGTSVTQKLKIVPNRLFEQDGHKVKDMMVEFERKERTKRGKRSRDRVQFELRELRSEDFEGRAGGPPVFVSRS